MTDLNRRSFLGTTAAAAATAAFTDLAAAKTESIGPEKVRIAVMGLKGRGRGLISAFARFSNVEIPYVCDPDTSQFPAAVKRVTDTGRKEPAAVKDFRTLLDRSDVDVLVCAAPDHWHALATVLACQAGKDVYVEKPISHNIVEGRRMVQAARKHNRVVQVGTQRRSAAEFQQAVRQVREGRIGNVHFARAWISSTRPNIGHVEVTRPPSHLDFDLWAGPAVDPHYKTNLVHYHWHWRWLYGTGECGNNGIHLIDIARWGMGVESPRIVSCGGDKYFFDDDQETPDTQLATFDCETGAIQWEHRTWSPRGIDGSGHGIVFYGSEGTLSLTGNGWTITRGKETVERQKGTSRSEWIDNHVGSFLECLETRERPSADIEIGHRTTTMCHLANMAWRTRSTLRFDAETETIVDNDDANALLSRTYREGYELPAIV